MMTVVRSSSMTAWKPDHPALIRKFPCMLVELTKHSGAGASRNAGGMNSKGGILFFCDADCILEESTIVRVRQ